MRRLGWTVIATLAAGCLGAAPAAAEDYCVGEDPCLPTLAAALEAARDHAGPDRVLLRDRDEPYEVPAGAADAAGEPVEIIGEGPATELTADLGATSTLWLGEPLSRATSLALSPPGPAGTETLLLAGAASRLVVSAPLAGDAAAARLLAGARMSDTMVDGPVAAATQVRIERSFITTARDAAISIGAGTGTAVVEQVEVEAADGAAAILELGCAAVSARHLTVIGAAPRVVDAACEEAGESAAFDLRSSVVAGEFPDVARLTGEATATSFHSAHDEDADVQATARLALTDPGFTSTSDRRPKAGSPLVDAGEPGALLPGEGFWDFGSRARVADGDGDGSLRRDVGAHERQPPVPEAPAGNVLLNPGAESGGSILTTGDGPEPPAWTRTGAFTQVGYGASARSPLGDITLPTREAGVALGGGLAFFSAGPGEDARLIQRIDVTASAAEIDTGLAAAALSGLLGGYGADDDEVRVTATFRDPAGNALSALDLGAVTAADRGNATNLLHRSAAGAMPPRTRAVDVEIAGTRVSTAGSSETYADAYADNLALVLSVPGIPVPGPVDPATPPVKNLRPFAGVTVLTGRPKLSSTGRAKVRLACASATVGRCSGSLELRRQLSRARPPSRIAQFARFDLGAGRSATVTIKLTLAARRALRRAKSFRATLRAVARDGQGLERKTTIPIRLVRSAPVRRG